MIVVVVDVLLFQRIREDQLVLIAVNVGCVNVVRTVVRPSLRLSNLLLVLLLSTSLSLLDGLHLALSTLHFSTLRVKRLPVRLLLLLLLALNLLLLVPSRLL